MEKPSMVESQSETKSDLQDLKKILLPFWLCRCLLLLLMVVAYIASIYWIGPEVEIRGAVLAATILIILLSVVCISGDVVTTILLARDALTAAIFLGSQVAETMVWIIIIGLEIFCAIETSKSRNFLSWFISAILFLAFIGMLIYSAIVFHHNKKQSKRGTYTPAHHYSNSEHSLQARISSPSNPFDNAYAASLHSSTHSRNISTASRESMFPPPPPYDATRTSTPSTPNSFVIITPPDKAASISRAPSGASLRFA